MKNAGRHVQTNNWLLIGQDSGAKLETRPKGSSPCLTSFSCLFKQTISWTQGNCQQQSGKLGTIRETRCFTDFRGVFFPSCWWIFSSWSHSKVEKKTQPIRSTSDTILMFFILWVWNLPHDQHRYYQHHGPEKKHKTRKFKLERCRIHRVEDKSSRKLHKFFRDAVAESSAPESESTTHYYYWR